MEATQQQPTQEHRPIGPQTYEDHYLTRNDHIVIKNIQSDEWDRIPGRDQPLRVQTGQDEAGKFHTRIQGEGSEKWSLQEFGTRKEALNEGRLDFHDKWEEASQIVDKAYRDEAHRYAPIQLSKLDWNDVEKFTWKAESGSVQSYQHQDTGRYVHIDRDTGQFLDQQRNPITQTAALDHAAGKGNHSQEFAQEVTINTLNQKNELPLDSTPRTHHAYDQITKSLHPDDATQFKSGITTGDVHSYQHKETGRYIHIDNDGQFFTQQKQPITQQEALDRAMGAGNHHAEISQHKHDNGISF